MEQIAISFAALVKNNNGMFKSDKQAAFLLGQCNDGENVFTCAGTVYGNTYRLFYHCNASGVYKVEKYTPKSGKTVTTWQRAEQAVFAVAKAIADEKKAQRAIHFARYNKINKLSDKLCKAYFDARLQTLLAMFQAGATDEQITAFCNITNKRQAIADSLFERRGEVCRLMEQI